MTESDSICTYITTSTTPRLDDCIITTIVSIRKCPIYLITITRGFKLYTSYRLQPMALGTNM